MSKSALSLTTAVLLALQIAPAQALNTRSFVSANGVDTNPCTRPAPCRTLAFALTQTSAGGEINTLDPAGYGTVTIDRSISIVNDGVGSAGILVPSGGTGITVNAGASDVVHLRGLIIEGAGAGQAGIQFNSGKSLSIENSVIRNLTAVGIFFLPNASSALSVADTLLADIGNTAIHFSPAQSGVATGSLSRIEVVNNIYGLYVIGGSFGASSATSSVTVADSVFSGSSATGVVSQTIFGAPVDTAVMVKNCAVVNSASGVAAVTTGAVLRLSQSTITGNGTGWFESGGGALRSYGNNRIDGNGAGETPPTLIAKK